jgi:chromate transporter
LTAVSHSSKANLRPSLLDIVRYFLTLGATGFGGPVALANYMRADLVEARRWLDDAEYDEGLAIATACPGPLAYQLGIYCGYVLRGVPGAIAAALAFAAAPFVLVCAAAYLYVRYAGEWETRALFYGVAPIVVALIVKACWNLGRKTLGRDPVAWGFFVSALALTLAVQRELALLFVAAGVLGTLVFERNSAECGKPRGEAHKMRSTTVPLIAVVSSAGFAGAGTVAALFLFFFKTGLLVFGSGLVIVPFLKAYVVDQYHWLSNRQFLDAVAVGMISPGPVVITATFVGFLLKGLPGALAATTGIFLPPFGFTVLATPLLRKYRSNARVRGFLRGVTVAVVGVLAGTVYFVGRSAVGDWLTLALAAGSLLLAIRGRLPDQLLVGLGAVVGLIAYPHLRPEWVLR